MFFSFLFVCFLHSLSHYFLGEIRCSCEESVASWTYTPISEDNENKEHELFGTSTHFQFGASMMVTTSFERLVGYRTLHDKGHVDAKGYSCDYGSILVFCLYVHVIPTHMQTLPTLQYASISSS